MSSRSTARTPVRTPAKRRRRFPWWATALTALATAVGVAAAITAGLRPSAPPPPADTAIVATVNGQGVPVREFEIFLAQERAATFEHFQQVYGTTDGPRFWTTPHGGTTPTAYLKTVALADATRTTVLLQLAHQDGLLPDPSYAAFVRAWTAENAARARAASTNQVIYGPTRYTEPNYLTYVLGNLTFGLQQRVSGTTAPPGADAAARLQATVADQVRSATVSVDQAVYNAVTPDPVQSRA